MFRFWHWDVFYEKHDFMIILHKVRMKFFKLQKILFFGGVYFNSGKELSKFWSIWQSMSFKQEGRQRIPFSASSNARCYTNNNFSVTGTKFLQQKRRFFFSSTKDRRFVGLILAKAKRVFVQWFCTSEILLYKWNTSDVSWRYWNFVAKNVFYIYISRLSTKSRI